MAYEHLCMYCFEETGGKSICPHCGRDARAAVPAIQLLPGTLLHNGRFLVGRARGQDAGGIVYTALDTKKNTTLRIREYLPRESARRLGDGTVAPVAGEESAFDEGLSKLRSSVEDIDDPRKRHFFFEENGTGYIAERKTAAAAAAGAGAAEGGGRNARQIAIIVAIAVVVVLAVAFVIIRMLDNAVDTPVTPVTTLSSDSMWMPEGSPTPTPYVGTTIGAIKDPELSWMDYVYPGNVDEEYDRLNTKKPTAKPTTPPSQITPAPTTGTIDDEASEQEIRDLQNVLVKTGWLSSSDVSGKYDAATKKAVAAFQQYMNDTYAIDPKLTVDGIAGKKTLYWLYQYDLSTKPTPTPTVPPRVTPEPDKDQVDENSPAAAIKYVQKQLIVLDLLPEGADDGVYGAATREAVKKFQKTVNRIQGRDVLKEDGTADSATQAYLDYYAEWWPANKPTPTPAVTPTAKPTEVPTEVPTEAPTATPTAAPTETPTVEPDPTEESNIVVDENSPEESVRYVQEMLATLGVLDSGKVDGKFGSGTRAALVRFQERVNELQGGNVLNTEGNCDALTIQYLEFYYEKALEMQTPEPEITETPTETPTEVPTATPTVKPTETPAAEPTEIPTEEPTEEPEPTPESNIVVDKNSPTESIVYVQEMLATLGLLEHEDVDGVFGSGTASAISAFQAKVNDLQGSEVLAVTGQCDALTIQYLEYYYEQVLSQMTPVPEVTEKPADPTEKPADPTEKPADPTEEPTEDPTEEPTEAPTEAPVVGTVSDPYISLSNIAEADGGVQYVTGAFTISWGAEGDVDRYFIGIADDQGNEYIAEETHETSMNVPESQLEAGRIYTVTIGVMPVNGTTNEDAKWTTAQFALKVAEPTPTPEPEPTPTPEPVVGTVSDPYVSMSNVAEASGGVQYVTGAFTLNWGAEGDVDRYYISISDDQGNEYIAEETGKTSMEVPESQLKPGYTYTVRIGVMPINGSNEDAKWTTAKFALKAAEPTPEPEPELPQKIDKNTDPEWILEMQTALYKAGWLPKEAEKGVFDQLTRQAVADFQTYMNETYVDDPNYPVLTVIDPEDENASVDLDTLMMILEGYEP